MPKMVDDKRSHNVILKRNSEERISGTPLNPDCDKTKGRMLTDIMSRSNHASTSTIYSTKLHTDALTVYTCIIDTIVGVVQPYACICVHISNIMA